MEKKINKKSIFQSRRQFRFGIFMNLIRAIFPRWNFFERVAYGFELHFKVPDALKWEQISFDQKRTPLSLLINPSCNLALAQVCLLEHFARDIQELQEQAELLASSEVQSLTTFKMVSSLLKSKLQEYELETGAIQFKIVACGATDKVDVYISDWITLESV
jgi:hypothetical protein